MQIPALRSPSRARWPTRIAAAVVMLGGLAGACPGLLAAELPGTSIYQLDVPLVDQDGAVLHLRDRQGKPALVSMFYTSCPYLCPLVIDTLLKTEHTLDPSDRSRLDVLLVSFDPAHDTPEKLKAVALQRKLDTPRWTLARTDADHVRKLAALLDIQYRASTDGEFNHSSALILLDAQGRIAARSDKLGEADPELVAALKRLVAAP